MSQASNVINCIARIFDDPTYSDLTVKCGEKSWKLHRNVVCSQSKPLHAAFTAGFKEQETGIIDLPDDDPVAVEMMLTYFYTGDYPGTSDGLKKEPLPLICHVTTYILADKYNIPTLMVLASKKFASALTEGVSTGEFLGVIPDVYNMSVSKNALRPLAASHGKTQFRTITLTIPESELLRVAMAEVPDFAFDVLLLFSKASASCDCYAPPKLVKARKTAHSQGW